MSSLRESSVPPPYWTKETSKYSALCTPRMQPDMSSTMTPEITHQVMGGALSLTPVEPASTELEMKLQSVQKQMSALTQIVENEKLMRGQSKGEQRKILEEKELPTRKGDNEISLIEDSPTTSGAISKRTPEPTKQAGDPFAVYGIFTGIVGESEFNEEHINGEVNPFIVDKQTGDKTVNR